MNDVRRSLSEREYEKTEVQRNREVICEGDRDRQRQGVQRERWREGEMAEREKTGKNGSESDRTGDGCIDGM